MKGRVRWYAPPVRITQLAGTGAAGAGRALASVEGESEGEGANDAVSSAVLAAASAVAGEGVKRVGPMFNLGLSSLKSSSDGISATPELVLLAWCAVQWLTCLLVIVGMVPALWRCCMAHGGGLSKDPSRSKVAYKENQTMDRNHGPR